MPTLSGWGEGYKHIVWGVWGGIVFGFFSKLKSPPYNWVRKGRYFRVFVENNLHGLCVCMRMCVCVFVCEGVCVRVSVRGGGVRLRSCNFLFKFTMQLIGKSCIKMKRV